ncbi:MAG: hypothetical protein A2234_02330 [Elusimicrobia bacterium RIFOXYA2_FULL_58_8]|nr:MAG: hypothetical protein A2285_02295 [Elusimicrobia bacterium RIFOXYA12_FULL_57_11]OGS13150.1 MAG: hypothetical protein A2234_02330 [Elusimicrobia bacterium RIFOXYA2_FULL_58_8]
MGEFAKNLIKARSEAGFETAYKFYHRNGGRRHFPFTFVHYTRIEKGGSLPRPEWIEPVFVALRLLPTQLEARNLLRSFISDLLGGEKNAGYILAPLLSGAKPEDEKFDPMKLMKSAHSVHLTPDEFAVMTGNEAAYWCAEALFNEADAFTSVELAEKTGFKAGEVLAALNALVAAGLVIKAGKGKYRCRYEGKFFTYPGRLEGMGKFLDKAREYWEKAAKKEGRIFFERLGLIRTTESAISGYRLNLAQAVDSANACIVNRSGPDTAFFLIESRIRKIKRF